MKVFSAFLVLTLLVAASLGCCLKDCCCGCDGLNLGCGLQSGCGYGCGLGKGYGYGLGNGYGYGNGYGNGYGYSNAYGAAYNPYNSYGAGGCCNSYGCNPVMACLMKKLKPCLCKKALIMKKICKNNLIARKCLCDW